MKLVNMRAFFSRSWEELFPFWPFAKFKKKKLAEANSVSSAGYREKIKRYNQLPDAELEVRLGEEHQRGKAIDEKTVKFSATISIALTILSSAGSLVISDSGELASLLATLLISFSVFYAICGGLLSLGALKTLPTFGFGTEFLLQKKDKKDAVAVTLISQEIVNIVRQLRNEAAYQCIRNGLILFLLALLVFAYIPIVKQVSNNEPPKTFKSTCILTISYSLKNYHSLFS